MPAKPLLLIDVDGVISLFGFEAARPPAGRFQLVDGIGHLLSADAGGHLLAVQHRYELAWCTGWEERANDYLPPLLGLPGPLPYLSFEHNPGRGNTHWKLTAIDAFAGPDRPLAWIDDGHDGTCRDWAAARPGATLLVGTEPAVGIAAEHVEQLLRFADVVEAGPAGPAESLAPASVEGAMASLAAPEAL